MLVTAERGRGAWPLRGPGCTKRARIVRRVPAEDLFPMTDRANAHVLARLDATLLRVETATAWIAGAVIFLMMGLVTAEVLMRRFLNAPIPGQQDITVLAMASFGVLCISYGYRMAAHVRMDLVINAMTGRWRWILQFCLTVLALFTITAILPGSWSHFMRAYAFGDSTIGAQLPTWPSKLTAPVGLAILWLRLALELWVYARLIRWPDAAPVGVPQAPDPRQATDG